MGMTMDRDRQKQKKVSRVLWAVLLLNLLVSAVKIVVGLATHLQAVLADGYHSISDGFSNVIGLIGIRFAGKPIDEDHAYGHSRYETLAGLGIVALLVYLGISITVQSLRNFSIPSFSLPSTAELVALVATLCVNVVVALLEHRAGVALNSTILKSDAHHTFSDIYVTCGVLFSVLSIRFFNAPVWLDSVVSLVVALFIFKAAYQIFRDAADELTDRIAVDPDLVERIVRKDQRVRGVHKVRSRRSGEFVFLDFHVQCDPAMRLDEVHSLSHRLDAMLNEELGSPVSSVIHVEPWLGEAQGCVADENKREKKTEKK